MFISPMPINADGDGPEMNEALVVKTLYQVWDYDFFCIKEFDTQLEAEEYVKSHVS